MTARVVPDDAEGRTAAIEVLRAGGVVAFPTDTVYGIAVALETPGGIERLFEVKGRPAGKGIVLLLADAVQAGAIGVMGDAGTVLGKAWWPGGLTLVVAQRSGIALPAALTGGSATIGLRVPDHAAPRALARDLGPLPTTSANVSGEPDARDAAEVLAQLGDVIELVLDGGPARGGTASTVIDCSGDSPTVLRVGAIEVTRLAETLDAAGVVHALRSEALG
jgi:L-threonylcarbamoyladenylate synthase